MTEELATKACAQCRKTAKQIINTERNERVGWWCIACNHFEKAILRERLWRRVGELDELNNT